MISKETRKTSSNIRCQTLLSTPNSLRIYITKSKISRARHDRAFSSATSQHSEVDPSTTSTESIVPSADGDVADRPAHPTEAAESRHDAGDDEALRDFEQRIFVLGSNPKALFFAHSLGQAPSRPPISLILNRRNLVRDWHREGKAITVSSKESEQTCSGMSVEVVRPLSTEEYLHSSSMEAASPSPENTSSGITWRRLNRPIGNLIVTSRSHKVVRSLLPLKARMGPGTTICFIDDNPGVIDDVNALVFPDSSTRPAYIHVDSSHTPRKSKGRRFSITDVFPHRHCRFGSLSIPSLQSPTESEDVDKPIPTTGYMVDNLLQSPGLRSSMVTGQYLHQKRLEDLAHNSVIGILTAIFGCRNETLLKSDEIWKIMQNLIAEISPILQASYQQYTGFEKNPRFEPDRIFRGVVSRINNKPFYSDEVISLNIGRSTDINYLNGYIARRAVELGMACPLNDMLISIVKGKMSATAAEPHIPLMPTPKRIQQQVSKEHSGDEEWERKIDSYIPWDDNTEDFRQNEAPNIEISEALSNTKTKSHPLRME